MLSSIMLYRPEPDVLTYLTVQNFGGRKSWKIWQIVRDSSKFSCPKFSFLKVEVAIWCTASFLNSTSKLNSMLSF